MIGLMCAIVLHAFGSPDQLVRRERVRSAAFGMANGAFVDDRQDLLLA